MEEEKQNNEITDAEFDVAWLVAKARLLDAGFPNIVFVIDKYVEQLRVDNFLKNDATLPPPKSN